MSTKLTQKTRLMQAGNALRVFPAVTRLTVYRRLHIQSSQESKSPIPIPSPQSPRPSSECYSHAQSKPRVPNSQSRLPVHTQPRPPRTRAALSRARTLSPRTPCADPRTARAPTHPRTRSPAHRCTARPAPTQTPTALEKSDRTHSEKVRNTFGLILVPATPPEPRLWQIEAPGISLHLPAPENQGSPRKNTEK